MVVGYLTNLPNKVPEKQRAYQAMHKSIWYRPPGSKVYMNTFKLLFGLGMLGNVYSVFNLIKGKPT